MSLKELKNDLASVEKQLSKYEAQVKLSFISKQNILKERYNEINEFTNKYDRRQFWFIPFPSVALSS